MIYIYIRLIYRKSYRNFFQVALPSLQSPKNAVAPSDIVFNRPPAAYPISTGEFFTGVQSLHVKANTSPHSEICSVSNQTCEMKCRKKSVESSVLDDRKKESVVCNTNNSNDRNGKDIKFIDHETALTGPSTSKIPPPLTTFLIDSMVRSCSVGMLKHLIRFSFHLHCFAF